VRRTAIAVAVVLAVTGIGLITWPFVQHWRSGEAAAAAQHDLRDELQRSAPSRPAAPVARAAPAAPGGALVEMSIPRLGADWSWVVVEGTSPRDLERGPGHYTGTALPGGRGNVAIAGHRAGHGDPFLDFDVLRPGDRVVLQQGGTRWTYELTTAPEIVPVSADWLLDPLPGRALTLTTCWPRYGSSKRMYVRGRLVDVTSTGAVSEPGTQGS